MESEPSRPNLVELLRQAAGGEAAAREQLLRLYRPYLRLSAERRMPPIVKTRTDASDIVQQTLLDAVRGLGDFRGQTEPEFTAWINKLLERNLLQSIRNHTLGKRDVRLEQHWGDNSGGGSTASLKQQLPEHADVNGDGIVDEQDFAAIGAIIAAWKEGSTPFPTTEEQPSGIDEGPAPTLAPPPEFGPADSFPSGEPMP